MGRPLWQRNYYERLIRNYAELEKFRTYILHNPDRWVEDEENPLICVGTVWGKEFE